MLVLELDAELKEALIKMNLRVDGSHERKTTILTDFGKITYTSTDLYHALSDKTYYLNTSNSIVKEAIANGSTMFVVSTLYVAEHSRIKVRVSENDSETARAGVPPHGTGDESVSRTDTDVHGKTMYLHCCYIHG